jgi:predicted unusual protein kinase regulating ubiquinone biosynthesis (AarF/ABC1/UbiB family)
MAKKDAIPTSRLSRSSKVGKLAATQAAKQMGTRAGNVARRSDESREAALAKRQLETAEQIVAALGTMKGAAMKLGQVMSFLDVGLVPEEYREEFQAKLAELRDAAPKVAWRDMKKVIEGVYGEPTQLRLRRVAQRVVQQAGVAPRRALVVGEREHLGEAASLDPLRNEHAAR